MSVSTPPVKTKSGSAGMFADFASDFGVKVELAAASTGSKSQSKSSNFITPTARRSASQISNTPTNDEKATDGGKASPEGPESKRVRASLEYADRKINAPNLSPSQASPARAAGYDSRKDPGSVVKSMGMKKPPVALPEGAKRIFSRPQVLQSVSKKNFHYMHTPLEFRANALDKHAQFMADALIKKYSLSEPDPIGPTSQDTQLHIGRICCEGAEGRLNAKSVMLEGTLGLCNGRRIRLDLSRIADYALFPGQIVAVEGNNAGDGAFVVRKIYEGAPPPMPSHTPAQLQEFKAKNDGQPTVVWAASG